LPEEQPSSKVPPSGSYLAQFRKKPAKNNSLKVEENNMVAGLAQISDAELVQRTSMLNYAKYESVSLATSSNTPQTED